MRCLVIGGMGYLGRVLCPKLVEAGHEVRVFDLQLFGSTPILQTEQICGDIRDDAKVTEALNGMDAVINLAGCVGDPMCLLSVSDALDINCIAAKKIAEKCAYMGIEKYIFASSCSVYGSQPGRYLTEDLRPNPIDFYGQTKLGAEKAILSVKDINPIIFRFATLHGFSKDRMRFDLVVNKFVAQAIFEKKIRVFGGGQHRPFAHISDVSDVLVTAVEKNDVNSGHIFNLVSENVKITDLAMRVKKMFPEIEVEITQDIIDQRDYIATNAKLQAYFNYVPKMLIEDSAKEIATAINNGFIKNWKEPLFDNQKFMLSNKDAQRKLYGREI